MIKGIGTDIIEIERVKKAMKINKFRLKCFTKKELEIIEKKGISSAAANFSAKESVAKALGIGFSIFSPKDIEILRNEKGKPYVNLYNKAEELSKTKNMKNIKISLSHCKKYVVSFSIVE